MAQALPYLPSYKNIDKLFKKIESAKIPDAFTHKYLYETLGLKSVSDRALISLLKTLGFIDNSGKPTKEYAFLKNPNRAANAIGKAIKRAYAPLFDANENVNTATPEELKGLIAQVAGTEADITSKISGTFNSLNRLAKYDDFDESYDDEESSDSDEENGDSGNNGKIPLKPQFHYNIQIHLPSNASEETYLNIFNALRRTFE